jgi:hypothetical protein
MTFEERNAAWNGNGKRFFIQINSKAQRHWGIWVEGNVVHYQWGQVGGALQHATEIAQGVNIGKKNEKSPEEYALYRAREMSRKKEWEGYREVDLQNNFLDKPSPTSIDFDNLPLALSFYKPDNSMGAGITKKAEAGKVWYARKRNGLMFVLTRGAGPAKLYSRRMLRQHDDEAGTALTWDDRFPHIIMVANHIMPPNSILLGELVLDRDGNDDFKAVQSYTKSLTEQSLMDQASYGAPSFYAWDIAFWKGEDMVSKSTVKERFDLLHEIDWGGSRTPGTGFIHPVQFFESTFFKTTAEAIEYAKKMKWEGFVVVDPEGVYGEKAYNYKGKPDRPGSVCAKLKPEFEDDFVAIWNPEAGYGERSTKGRNDQGIKSVALYQFNAKGESVYISNVSSGLTDDMKKNLADPNRFPQVWKVKYTDRTYISNGDDTNALTFARYEETRTDKNAMECINTEL